MHVILITFALALVPCVFASAQVPPAQWDAAGGQPGAQLGAALAGAGDVNGDGFGDLVVGLSGYSNDQPHEGRVHVYHGSSQGPSLVPDWIAEGDANTALFGYASTGVGDVNG